MAIFNSLGSNYSLSFALRSLSYLFFPPNCDLSASQLSQRLNHYLPGNYLFLYKGRHALTQAIKSLGLTSQDTVLTQALTCHAVESGIVNSGAEIGFIDIQPGKLVPSIAQIQQGIKKYPRSKAIIIQHTLGYPAEIDKISYFCHHHHLFLIEDLAHAFSGQDKHRRYLGSTADAVILSFGKDKILDVVSGGALIVKHQLQIHQRTLETKQLTLDLLYPILTQIIRLTYFPFGKMLHRLLRSSSLFKSPVLDDHSVEISLPAAYLRLLCLVFDQLDSDISHRRQIATIYSRQLSKSSPIDSDIIDRSTCLRYPVLVDKPQRVIFLLAHNQIFIPDTWYRAPVDSGSLKLPTLYPKGSCSQAEYVSSHLINLPTHRQITPRIAHNISTLIKPYLIFSNAHE